MKHPVSILEDLSKGACCFYQVTYKRPVYYYEEDGLYRMMLHDTRDVALSVPNFTDFSVYIEGKRSKSPLALTTAIYAKGPDGIPKEVLPVSKVRVLVEDYDPAGSLLLDESPKSYNFGIGVSCGRELVAYDNSLFQKYLDRRKHLRKLEAKAQEIRSQFLHLSKQIESNVRDPRKSNKVP